MAAYLLLHVTGTISALASLVSLLIIFIDKLILLDLLLVVGESRELQVTPSLVVNGSVCERIHIQGFPRGFQHLDKYTHSLKLIVNASTTTGITSVCFHRNSSLGIGMCPQNGWEEVVNGFWIATMSPFYRKIVDVRVAGSSNVTLQVSMVEEPFMYRLRFLIVGTVLLTWASTLSASFAFYCICCTVVGVVIAFLLVLYQVVKRLPDEWSSSAFFLYSALVGLTFVTPRYIPSLFQVIREAFGFKDRILFGQLLVLLLGVQLMGVSLGFGTINTQLLLAHDGSIDIGTSRFMSWSIWILAAVLILQSSGDALLAGGALVFAIAMSPILRKITGFIFPNHCVCKILIGLLLNMWHGISYVIGPTVSFVLIGFFTFGRANREVYMKDGVVVLNRRWS